MKVKDLIEELQRHNPDAEVHIVNDRGYYEYIGSVSCSNEEDSVTEDEDGNVEWHEPPTCDGSCKNSPVVLSVD